MAYKARERTVGCTKQRIAQAGTGLEVNGQVQEVVPGAEKKTKDGCVDAAVRNQDIHSMGIVMGPRCGFHGGGCVMIWYSGIRVFTQLQTNQPISRVKKGEKVTNFSGRFQYFHWTHTFFLAKSISGWWFFALPLWKMMEWVRQLGLFPKYHGKVIQNSMVPVCSSHHQPDIFLLSESVPI